jgi:hypothetical protein
MRTTLAIDDDVLIAAKAIARQQKRSVGKVISELARCSLPKPQPHASRNGIQLLPRGDREAVVTFETVKGLLNH